MRLLCACLLLGILAPAVALAQGFRAFNERNHPHLDWQVADTRHFQIIYPSHLAGIEEEAAAVAEATYETLSAQLGVTFDRPIRIYLSDEDEIANGFAVAIGPGHTNIWVHVSETAEIWTGREKWLRKVIAHEVAHIFHFRAARSPLGLAQTLVANPFPRFWTEGLAQYLTEDWDAQRGDRWLRTAVFDGRLSYQAGTEPADGRLLYASGNSQVRYLAQAYGDTTIARILEHRRTFLPGLPVHDFYSAFREVVGKPYREFYDEWRRHVAVHYHTMAGQMERTDSLGTALRIPGAVIHDLVYSPDTSMVAALVLTSAERPVRRIAVLEGVTDTLVERRVRVVAEGDLAGTIAWRPDGGAIAYSRRLRGDHGSLLNDVFVHDLEGRRTTRLTRSRRAHYPTFAPDGRRLAYVVNEGPEANVFVYDLDTATEARLTNLTGDVQLVGLRWSPDGGRLVSQRFDEDGSRHLVLIDAETGETTNLGVSGADVDDRFPVWSPDGGSLAFTSLRDDVPNVFVVAVDGGRLTVDGGRLTVDGGRLTVDGGRLTVDGGRLTVDGGRLTEDRRDSACAVRPEDCSPIPSIPSIVSIQSTQTGPQRETGNRQPATARRVTHVFTGARVTDWLPPDEAHPVGRLLLVSTEDRRREHAFLVDARREPTVDAAPAVPEAYRLWTEQQPEHELPSQIPPEPELIERRYAYNSWRNITHAISLVLPYAELDGSDFGIAGATMWLEPLGKHQIAAFGSVSFRQPLEDTYAALVYTNNQLAPSLTLSLYRYPDPARWYGTTILVEDLAGIDLSASLPLDVVDVPFFRVRVDGRARWAHATPFAPDAFEDIEFTSPLLAPESGFRSELRFGITARHQRPYRYNDIYPLDGTGVRLRATAGLPVFGAETRFVRPDLQSYWVSPEIGIGRFFLYGRAQAQFGRTLAQDFIGLSRYDDVDLQLPMLEPITLSDTERVRGYRQYAVGDRVLFGTVEYRLPPFLDLQTRLLGFLRLGRVSPALFVDAGMVWTGGDLENAVRRTGVGVELKNRVSLGDFSFTHAIGAAQRWRDLGVEFDLDHLDVYYRIQAVLPF